MDTATIIGLVIFLVTQLLVFIGVVFAAYTKTCVALRGLTAGVESCDANVQRIHSDYENLTAKVDGMSRHVAGVEAVHKLCPYLNNSTEG